MKDIFALLKNKRKIAHVTPYQDDPESKKVQVRKMFDRIARHYDFLNHALSLGTDIRWRKKAIAQVSEFHSGALLDVATGTGDMALMMARKYPEAKITGIDISDNMLTIARTKSGRAGFSERIDFQAGDSEKLAFPDNTFDAVTVAFGVRNFEDLQKGLCEMQRVVKPGGKAVILEFSRPRTFPFKQLFGLYFKHLLPWFGKLRSKDQRAYTYLYESVQAFPDYERLNAELVRAGWKNPQYKTLSFGICAIYTASK